MRLDRVHLHAPRDAAQHGGAFVMAEKSCPVCARTSARIFGDRLLVFGRARFVETVSPPGASITFASGSSASGISGGNCIAVLVLDELEQLRRHLRDRQHPVDHPGADRRRRHAVELRFVRVLRDRQPALRADVLQPDHAIRVRARHDHADRALPVSLRQGAEEQIDRHPPAEPLLRRHEVAACCRRKVS